MFSGIQHMGYLVDDLDKAVAWFRIAFDAENAGGGAMADSRIVPGGGINAFVRFGDVEVELMQPTDTRPLPKNTLVLHHIGYVVEDIDAAAAHGRAKGLRFLADAPYTNPMGQQVLYFDPDTTHGAWMHLTKVPPKAASTKAGPRIDRVLHPGYLVRNAEAAAAWCVEKLGGIYVGGGASRRGGRVAFVDCGAAQIEFIEPQDPSSIGTEFVLDHVGYVTSSLTSDLAAYRARGLSFATDAPAKNPIGQTLIYFDPATSMGTRMHLTDVSG